MASPPAGPSFRTLEGKIAIITGASRGIGASIATNLASKGATLFLNYTSQSSASLTQELSTSLEKTHSIKTYIIQADMGTPTGPAHLISSAKTLFETAHPDKKFQIDILLNNAGVSVNNVLEDVTIEDYNFQYAVNVLGPLLLTQAAIPFLPHDRSGRIINVSSVSSSLGFIGQTIYGGTKAALEAMTRTWSRELAESCTVNAINPGPVGGDMWTSTTSEFKVALSPFVRAAPLQAVREGVDSKEIVDGAGVAGGRPAYTWEIAGVVGMLCSADSSWVTGQVICANGGMRMEI